MLNKKLLVDLECIQISFNNRSLITNTIFTIRKETISVRKEIH